MRPSAARSGVSGPMPKLEPRLRGRAGDEVDAADDDEPAEARGGEPGGKAEAEAEDEDEDEDEDEGATAASPPERARPDIGRRGTGDR